MAPICHYCSLRNNFMNWPLFFISNHLSSDFQLSSTPSSEDHSQQLLILFSLTWLLWAQSTFQNTTRLLLKMQISPFEPLTLILLWLPHYPWGKNLNSQACLQVPSCSGSYTSSGLISLHSLGASWVNSTIPKHAETITFLGFCSCCASAWILLLSFLCLANSYACTCLYTGLFFRLWKSFSAWRLPQGCLLWGLIKFTKAHLKTQDKKRDKRMKYLHIRSYISPNSLCISPNNTIVLSH